MQESPLQTAAWFVPMALGGIIIGTVGSVTLHLLPGRILLMLSACGNLACTLLFALISPDSNYWAFVLPAMIGSTVGVNVTYNVSNIFITTKLPSHRQGQGGALINSILFLGISFFLGLADLAISKNEHLGLSGSYKVAFWFGVGLSAVSIVGFALIEVGTAKSGLTADEIHEKEGSRVVDLTSEIQQVVHVPSTLIGA
jgi:MFS family permease